MVDVYASAAEIEGYEIVSHVSQGNMKLTSDNENVFLDCKKIDLFLHEGQQGLMFISGHSLRTELASKSVLNSNILDFLLEHKELIPESWKNAANGHTQDIIFWGTIYRKLDYKDPRGDGNHFRSGDLRVRCLRWEDGQWFGDFRNLVGGIWNYAPAAVLSN